MTTRRLAPLLLCLCLVTACRETPHPEADAGTAIDAGATGATTDAGVATDAAASHDAGSDPSYPGRGLAVGVLDGVEITDPVTGRVLPKFERISP